LIYFSCIISLYIHRYILTFFSFKFDLVYWWSNKELEHINKTLQQKNDIANKLTFFVITGTTVLIGFIIKTFYDILQKGYETNNNEQLVGLTTLFLETLKYGSMFFIAIFTLLTVLELLSRKKIINRKVLILNELNKELKKSKYQKYRVPKK
jgi:magnesium-transporting ATPase (P-type)